MQDNTQRMVDLVVELDGAVGQALARRVGDAKRHSVRVIRGKVAQITIKRYNRYTAERARGAEATPPVTP